MACKIGDDCLQYGCGNFPVPEDGAIYTPFVEVQFSGGQIITIGNKSAPNINLTSVTSMSFGFTPNGAGYGCDLEFVDVGGTLYRKFIKALNKTIKNISEEIGNISVDFGWIITDCNGTTRKQSSSTETGKKIYGFINEVDASFEGALIKMKVKIRAPQVRQHETRHTGSMASEDQKITLKQAIRKVFTQYEPKYRGVDFKAADGSDNFAFKSEDGNPEGPKSTWPLDQQNTFSAVRAWLQSIVTVNDKGVLLIYDADNVRMIIHEDPTDKSQTPCNTSIATYVVNGGNCSPVISFTPSVTFIKGMTPSGGGTAGGASSGDSKEKIDPTDSGRKIENAGTQTAPAIQQHEWQFRSPEEHAVAAVKGQAAHMEAAQNAGEGVLRQPFEAELKIRGNPRWSDPLELVLKRNLSIIFINPFYIAGEDGCTWLQTSTCNSILSNKNYMIKGVNHQIQSGSYTTTFSLFLQGSNVDIDFDQPLGGAGGTETFTSAEDGMGQSIDAVANTQ